LPGFAPPPSHQPGESQDKQIQMGIWWPAADSARLRAAASAWRDMARAIEAVESASQPAVLNLLADNQGPAMDAFAAYWQKWSGRTGYLPTCSEACTSMAKALDEYAQAADDARAKVEQLVAEIGTAVVLGVVLGVCTVGIATAAAGAVSAGLIASAELVGITLTETAGLIISGALVGATFGAVESMAIDIVAIQPEKILLFHDQKEFSWNEVWQWVEFGAAGGFVGGGLGAGVSALRRGWGAAGDGARAGGEIGPGTWGWPPSLPALAKPGLGDVGAAEWRYQRYVFSRYQQGAEATEIMDYNAWRARYFDTVAAGGRPGRGGGSPQVATRQALTEEGYRNVENVQLGKGNFVDMVAKNDHGGTDFVEVDDVLKRGVPPARMRTKLAEEIAALGPNDTLLYVDKNDVLSRILYLPGDDVESLTVQGSLDRFGVGAVQ
jgi:hypothetical protein